MLFLSCLPSTMRMTKQNNSHALAELQARSRNLIDTWMVDLLPPYVRPTFGQEKHREF